MKKDETLLGYLIVDEVNRLLTKADASRAVILGTHMRRLLPSTLQGETDAKVLDDVIADLMQCVHVDEDRLASAISAAGWAVDDQFAVLAVAEDGEGGRDMGRRMAALFAKRLSREARPLVGREPFAAVVNCTRAGSVQAVVDILLAGWPFGALVFGASEPFFGLGDVHSFYDQAVFALGCLGKEEPAERGAVARYDACYVRDMIRRCAGFRSKQALLPAGLRRLLRHDDETTGDLVPLLATYLRCNLNITHTARAAFIHRNTCIAKMKHVEEIGGFDFDDPDTVLGLRIALEMLKRF